MERNSTNVKRYFAAANGYNGFRSYFKSIFDPRILAKMFIIKGGPGTGKSTLMRKVAEHFAPVTKVTMILCSSDPHSLDGIILEKNGVKVGIADGTNPHVIEPSFPGAVEEIINLGDGFDYISLRKKKDCILELCENKAECYEKAYSLLKISGELHEYVSKSSECYIEAESFLDKNIVKDDEPYFGTFRSDLLIGSFSLGGYTLLPTLCSAKKSINISGDGLSEYFITSVIADILSKRASIVRIYPSALSDKLVDAIETPSNIYTIIREGQHDIQTSALFKNNNEYAQIKSVYDKTLNLAQECLIKASKYHFDLESIYSSNICFEKNDGIFTRIIEEIELVFNK